MLNRILLIALLLLGQSGFSDEIIVSTDLKEVLSDLDKETWVILDLDNTVCRPTHHLGSDRWFQWRTSKCERGGADFEEALDEYTALQFMIPLVPCQDDTVSIISDLQDKGQTVLAVTSRGIRVATRTVYLLEAMGVDFSKSSPGEEEIFWPRGWTGRHQQHVLYEQGILFNSGQNKGIGLEKLLSGTGKKPKKVVFVDDTRKHVENVQAACEKLGIQCVGVHYTRMDKWNETFDEEVAVWQMDLLRRLVAAQPA